MPKLALILSALACATGGTALVLQLTERDVTERIFFTHNASYDNNLDVKETRAECPRGSMLIGGGEAVQHGHDAPALAIYQGFPVDDGWEVQGHETDPEDDPRWPWVLEAIAICLRR